VLWYVVIFGGVLTIVFLWMIHMDFIPQIFLERRAVGWNRIGIPESGRF
jgi:hypothetical protein